MGREATITFLCHWVFGSSVRNDSHVAAVSGDLATENLARAECLGRGKDAQWEKAEKWELGNN